MKALSIRQPWAHAILYLGKDMENRSRPTKYRGRFYIHAGLKIDDGWRSARNHNGRKLFNDVDDSKTLTRYGAWSRLGAILGSVELIDCVNWHCRSRWFSGKYGYLLARPFMYHTPIPCKGQLGFFTPPRDIWLELEMAEKMRAEWMQGGKHRFAKS